jgi:membrane protein
MAAILGRLPEVRVGRVDLTAIAKETIREVADDDVPGLAAEMAYHSILAIFPFLLFLAGLTSIIDNLFGVGNLTDRIVNKAAQVMPEDATSLLRSFTGEVVNSQGTYAIVFGLVGSLWAASAAIGSAMKALNRAYDVKEDRGFVRRKLIALALTLVFGGFLLMAAILIGSGGVMAGGIGRALGWQGEFVALWDWLTLPAALLLVLAGVATLYWLAPNTGHQLAWITPGALLFVISWFVASLAFAFYISNFGAYNRTYGSLTAVIILLVWLYYTNMLLLIGGELNAVLARRHDAEYRGEQGRRPATAGSKASP